MFDHHPSELSAQGLRVGLVVSRYHGAITASLRGGAERAFLEAGGAPEDLIVMEAPGSYELPVLCRALVLETGVDAAVALGCIITGETPHDRYIAQAVASGLMTVAAETGTPVSFGVLTCATLEQAKARAGGSHGNKGAEAMLAAIEAASAIRGLRGEEGAAAHARRA
jgi:6,7-dimethyl-8-ribityllumazine synthase